MENIEKSSDIQLVDTNFFNLNYDENFTFVNDIFTQKKCQSTKDYNELILDQLFSFLCCHSSIAVQDKLSNFELWSNTQINFEDLLLHMNTIKELDELFDCFEEKNFPDDFLIYVDNIRLSLKIYADVEKNQQYKSLTDDSSKKNINLGYYIRKIYSEQKTEIDKLYVHWVNKLPSGTNVMCLLLSILNKSYFENCLRRAKETISTR